MERLPIDGAGKLRRACAARCRTRSRRSTSSPRSPRARPPQRDVTPPRPARQTQRPSPPLRRNRRPAKPARSLTSLSLDHRPGDRRRQQRGATRRSGCTPRPRWARRLVARRSAGTRLARRGRHPRPAPGAAAAPAPPLQPRPRRHRPRARSRHRRRDLVRACAPASAASWCAASTATRAARCSTTSASRCRTDPELSAHRRPLPGRFRAHHLRVRRCAIPPGACRKASSSPIRAASTCSSRTPAAASPKRTLSHSNACRTAKPCSIEAAAESWPLAEPFVIARGAKTRGHVVVATVVGDGHSRAAASPCPTRATARPSRRAGRAARRSRGRSTGRAAASLLPAGAARNALDCALWDLEAKRAAKRAWELAGLPDAATACSPATP